MKAEPTYKLIAALRADGTLVALVRCGLMAPKVVAYADMYARVEEKRRRLKRTPHKLIIVQVAEEFRVSTATVYRAINTMRRPLHTPAKTKP